jgi:hypothetical protein
MNTMCGGGTIELKFTNQHQSHHPFSLIARDANEDAVASTAERLKTLKATTLNLNHRPLLIDLIIWDAQRLLLQSWIAEVLLADLPFAGSTKKLIRFPPWCMLRRRRRRRRHWTTSVSWQIPFECSDVVVGVQHLSVRIQRHCPTRLENVTIDD